MNASKLIEQIQEFIAKNGDLEIESEYWCVDCRDTHSSNGVKLIKTYDNKMMIVSKHLGED